MLTLTSIENAVRDEASSFDIDKIYLFGSYARAKSGEPLPPSAIRAIHHLLHPAPKGKSDSFAILRHWRPMGIPMTVMQ